MTVKYWERFIGQHAIASAALAKLFQEGQANNKKADSGLAAEIR